MKKLLLSALVVSTFSLGVDAQIVKKVLLEDFTGKWCGFCVNGSKGIDDLKVTYPTNFLPVATHNDNSPSIGGPGDVLEIAEGDFLASPAGLGSKGFPSGAVDRTFDGTDIRRGINGDATQWKTVVGSQSQLPAIVSVSFENQVLNADGKTYEVDVNVKFESAPESEPIVMQVFILEDSIEAEGNLAQSSYTQWYGGNGSTSSPVSLTSSGNNFYHNHTLRAALGGNWGYPIASPEVGKVWTKHVSVTIPATAVPKVWVREQLHMYAFVAYNGTGLDKKAVLNAEEIPMAIFNKLSVNNINNGNVKIMTAYPNPAATNELVKVSYSIANSELVTMNVYNVVGKQVAQPYVSNEVKGSHTIQWNPANDALAPGMYIIEVSTPSGKQVQRITLQ